MFSKLNKAIEAVTVFYTTGHLSMVKEQLDYNQYLSAKDMYEKRVVRVAWLKQLDLSDMTKEREEELGFLEWYLKKYPEPKNPTCLTQN